MPSYRLEGSDGIGDDEADLRSQYISATFGLPRL